MAEVKIPVSLIGKSALLCHNPAMMGKGKSGPRGAKYIPTPEEEAKAGLYEQNGHFCFPGIGPRNALVSAAGAWKIKMAGSSRKVSARPLFASIQPYPELVPILDANTGKPLTKYEVDTRRAVVQKNGILRSRPVFKSWRLDFNLLVDAEDEEQLRQVLPEVLDYAGRRIGIGDYRPAKGGWFGRFERRG